MGVSLGRVNKNGAEKNYLFSYQWLDIWKWKRTWQRTGGTSKLDVSLPFVFFFSWDIVNLFCCIKWAVRCFYFVDFETAKKRLVTVYIDMLLPLCSVKLGILDFSSSNIQVKYTTTLALHPRSPCPLPQFFVERHFCTCNSVDWKRVLFSIVFGSGDHFIKNQTNGGSPVYTKRKEIWPKIRLNPK